MVPPLAGMSVESREISPFSIMAVGMKVESMSDQLPLQNSSASVNGKPRRGRLHFIRAIGEKPRWLQAIYLLFVVVCLNAVLMYNREKQMIFIAGGVDETGDDSLQGQYSAGAEEHVVSQSYGSTMYGGGIHTHRDKKKKPTESSPSASKKFEKLQPAPDGTKDMNLKLSTKKGGSRSDMAGFSIYVMSDTPVSSKQRVAYLDLLFISLMDNPISLV